MEHQFYFDGNEKKISWAIKTKNNITKQSRIHPEIYLDIVNSAQAKYIAMHVGIFWCIGTFIIKNNDQVTIMIDSREMYDHLTKNHQNTDSFIQKRTGFYKHLIQQRMLEIKYQLIEHEKNIASNGIKNI